MSIPMPWMYVWELDIPQVAFTSDIVLNALFAISAVDLSSRFPEDVEMALASKAYFHKAVTAHRQLVIDDDEESAIPLFLTAVLLVSAFSPGHRQRQYPWSSAKTPGRPYH